MSTIKLLLADRSSTIQRIVGMALEDEPIELLLAGSGEEALALIQQDPPDIIVADMRLPDMTGIELCRAVREAGTRRIPFVLMIGIYDTMQTGSKEAIEEQARSVEVDDILVKPFDPKDLSRKVHDLVMVETPAESAASLSDTAPKIAESGEAAAAAEEKTAVFEKEPDISPAAESPLEPVRSAEGQKDEEATVMISNEDRVRILEEAGLSPSDETQPEVPMDEIEPELLKESEVEPDEALAAIEPEPLIEPPAGESELGEPPELSREDITETALMPAMDFGAEEGESAETPEETAVPPEELSPEGVGGEPTIPEVETPVIEGTPSFDSGGIETVTSEPETVETPEPEPEIPPAMEIRAGDTEVPAEEESSETVFMEKPASLFPPPPIPEPPEEREESVQIESPSTPSETPGEGSRPPEMEEPFTSETGPIGVGESVEAVAPAEGEPDAAPEEPPEVSSIETGPLADEPFVFDEEETVPSTPPEVVTDGPFDIWGADLEVGPAEAAAPVATESAEPSEVTGEEVQDETHPATGEDVDIISEGLKALEEETTPSVPSVPEFSLQATGEIDVEAQQLVEEAATVPQEPEEVDVVREKTLEIEAAGLGAPVEAQEPVAGETDVRALVDQLLHDDAFIERLAQKIVEHLGRSVLEDVAWQVVPDLAEKLIRERLTRSRASTQDTDTSTG